MATHPQLCKVTDEKVLGLDNLYRKIPHHCSHVLLVSALSSPLFFVRRGGEKSVNVQQCKPVVPFVYILKIFV